MKTFYLLLFTFLSPGIAPAQKKSLTGQPGDKNNVPAVGIIKGLSDDQLLEIVERQTFRYFWYGADPASGLALDRSSTMRAEHSPGYYIETHEGPDTVRRPFGPDACAIGGTGFGIMATVIAADRHWISRDTALGRLVKIADFLSKAD